MGRLQRYLKFRKAFSVGGLRSPWSAARALSWTPWPLAQLQPPQPCLALIPVPEIPTFRNMHIVSSYHFNDIIQLMTSISVDIRIYQASKVIFTSASGLGEYHFWGLINPYVNRNWWMDELGFYVPSTVFQSFRDDGRMNMKGSVQWSAI